MTHYESRLRVNNLWRVLLVVKAEEPQEFKDLISFDVGNTRVQYHVPGIHRKIIKDGEHIYWFLPTFKETIVTEDESAREQAAILEAQLVDTQIALCDVYEENLVLEEQLVDTQMALCDVYEENIELSEQLTDTQLALCDVYEQIIGGNE